MKRSRLLLIVLLTILGFFGHLKPVQALIIVDPDDVDADDIYPADPTTWDSSIKCYVGNVTAGTLLISDVESVGSWQGTIGNLAGSTGKVMVVGSDSEWTINSFFWIGNGGTGMLNINGGGVVSSGATVTYSKNYMGCDSGSTGIVSVDGLGSTWSTPGDCIYVGYSGSGTLNVTDGGIVDNLESHLGYFSGATGVANVDGPNSRWNNNGRLEVGLSGKGTLNITNDGTVFCYHGSVGCQAGSIGVVNVDGPNSTWTNIHREHTYSDRAIGRYGNGTLNITSGGTVNSDQMRLGYYSGSTGIAHVNGSGSTWTNIDILKVGHHGNGMLYITCGGLVSVADTLTIDYDGGNDSFINMSTGGMLALHGNAGESLIDFLGLIEGYGTIRYWDDSIANWSDILGATPEDDYTLAYINDISNDLHGYTVLTVGVIPEPSAVLLLLFGAAMVLVSRSR